MSLAYRIIKFDTPDAWLQIRRKFMSASKIGPAMGASDFAGPNDLAKPKRPWDFPDQAIYAMARGSEFEEIALDQYAICSHQPLIHRNDCFMASERHPLFGCTLDGMSLGMYGARIPVEVKCPMGRFPGEQYTQTVKGIPQIKTERIKPTYWLQVQTQMFVTGTTKAHLCFWKPACANLIPSMGWLSVYEVDFDNEFWVNKVVPCVEKVHMAIVSGDRAPELSPYEKGQQTKQIYEQIRQTTRRIKLPMSCDPLDSPLFSVRGQVR